MDWKLDDGNAKASIYPTGPDGEGWNPHDNAGDDLTDRTPAWTPSIDDVFKIRGVVEVDSCGAQGYHVIVEADSIKELPRAVRRVKAELVKLFERGAARAKVDALGILGDGGRGELLRLRKAWPGARRLAQ